eukprot:6229436-Pyramimonas_sp.AAC.2
MGTISTKEERAPAKAWTNLKEQVPDVITATRPGATIVFCDRSRQVYVDHGLIFKYSLGEVKWATCEEGSPMHTLQQAVKDVVARATS